MVGCAILLKFWLKESSWAVRGLCFVLFCFKLCRTITKLFLFWLCSPHYTNFVIPLSLSSPGCSHMSLDILPMSLQPGAIIVLLVPTAPGRIGSPMSPTSHHWQPWKWCLSKGDPQQVYLLCPPVELLAKHSQTLQWTYSLIPKAMTHDFAAGYMPWATFINAWILTEPLRGVFCSWQQHP